MSFNAIFITALFIFCFLLPVAADEIAENASENTVHLNIKVLNPAGNAISGVKVEVLETGQRVFTDERGRTHFDLPATIKSFTLRANTDTYKDVVEGPKPLEMLAGDTLTLQFSELRTFGETVVITGTKQETMLKDVTVRTEVITSQLINQRQAFTLADAIDGISGLRVENNCQNCGFNQLRINGLEGGYSRITVDGLSAFSSMSGVYGLEQIPSVIVDQVEVVKGGGSVLYGSGAVGGVVNVITKEPTSTTFTAQSSLASIDGATGSMSQASGSWVQPEWGTSLFFYGSFSKSEEYDRNGDGFSEIGRKQMESGGMKFYQSLLNDNAIFKLSLDIAHEWRRGGSNIDKPNDEVLVSEMADTLRRSVTAEWTHYFQASTYYQVQASYTKNERDTYYGAFFDPNAFGTTDNPHSLLNASLFHTIGDHSLSVGVQYENDELDDNHPGYNFRTLQEYDNIGLFVQDDMKLTDSISLLAGLRVDEHSALEDAVVSPRLSLMWQLTDNVRLRASYAFGFKAPLVFDEDLHITIANGDPTFIVNAEGLLPESVHSYSTSLEFSDTFSNGFTYRFETNLFYSNLDDTFVVDEVNTENVNFFVRKNGGGSASYGTEFTGDFTYNRFQLLGSFTVQQTKLDEPEPDFGATRFFKAPNEYGNLNLIYTADNWILSTAYTYTGSMLVPHFAGYINEDRLEETKEFNVFDVRLEIPFTLSGTSMSFMVLASNITDDFQEDFDKGPERDAGYVYGPRAPRTISTAIKVTF